MFRKASLLGLALGAVLMLGGASPARAADDWGRGCNARINHEQRELDRRDPATRLSQLAGAAGATRIKSRDRQLPLPVATRAAKLSVDS